MKKLVLSVLLLPVLAFAKDEPVIVDKKVVCNWTKTILETLSEDFEELPIWIGQAGDQIHYSVFTSAKGDWTIVQFNQEIACVIGAGSNSMNIPIKPNI